MRTCDAILAFRALVAPDGTGEPTAGGSGDDGVKRVRAAVDSANDVGAVAEVFIFRWRGTGTLSVSFSSTLASASACAVHAVVAAIVDAFGFEQCDRASFVSERARRAVAGARFELCAARG